MGLSGMLSSALSGLSVTSANLDLVGRNVVNADTPGYTAKRQGQAAIIAGDRVVGVKLLDVSREMDVIIQRQLRNERSGAGYADTIARFTESVDNLFGRPGDVNALDTIYNDFQAALEALSTSPESVIAQEQVVSNARFLTDTMNQMSEDIQTLRFQTEQEIAEGVTRVNEILGEIARLNRQFSQTPETSGPPADLLDQRDLYLEELSQWIDIRVLEGDLGTVSVMTTSGTSLLDVDQARLIFDQRGTVTPQSQWSSDPAQSGVGSLKLFNLNGYTIDLISDNAIRSGKLAGLIEMRDERLVEAQAQLDAFAEGLARSLTERNVDGTAVTAGPQSGFEFDPSLLQPGDRVNLTFTTTPPGTTRNVSIVRLDGTTSLSDPNLATNDPNDEVIFIDFSDTLPNIETAIETALAPEIDVAINGANLQILNDTGGNSVIDAVSVTYSETGLQGGSAALPLFIDGGRDPTIYSGALDGVPQRVGFAQRITVNDSLISDPSLLVRMNASTASGDPTRPNFILDRLNNGDWQFAADAEVGGSAFRGAPSDFVSRVVADQGRKAADAQRIQQAQTIAVNSLEDRQAQKSAVDIDAEMARLIELQAAFQANARLISAYRELTDILLQI